MCSTFKLLLAAAVLNRIGNGLEQDSTRLTYAKADLLEYAPITRAYVAQGGMGIYDLMAAAVEYSDNTAANLLLKDLGGPAKWTAFARWLGDDVSRLDRNEPQPQHFLSRRSARHNDAGCDDERREASHRRPSTL